MNKNKKINIFFYLPKNSSCTFCCRTHTYILYKYIHIDALNTAYIIHILFEFHRNSCLHILMRLENTYPTRGDVHAGKCLFSTIFIIRKSFLPESLYNVFNEDIIILF